MTGGVLTVKHLAFGPNSIQTAIENGEQVYASKANLRIKNLDSMVPLWRSTKRIVVGPKVRMESDEVTRDFCLLKDENLLGALGVKTKVLQFRLTCGTTFSTYHYRFHQNEYILYRASQKNTLALVSTTLRRFQVILGRPWWPDETNWWA